MKELIKLIFLILIPFSVSAFELGQNDKWYYEHQSEFGIKLLPDKMSHFYRSYLFVQAVDPEIVAISNIFYELYDERRGVGFSIKDLIADTMGIISGKLFNGNVMPLIVWRSETEDIQLTIYYRI